MKNILVLCTGNSCRSQILHGFLEKLVEEKVNIYSAGIETHGLNPNAVKTMAEIGIDISQHTSNNVLEYKDIDFDYIITVCNHANENCPYFPSNAVRIHHNFTDPAKAKGSEEEIAKHFTEVRDEIGKFAKNFVEKTLFFDKKKHWENVFATKNETEVSWYEPKPETSLQFFEKNNIPKSAKILEIGGGNSYLIDNLLEQGFESLTLLDISENAIEKIKKRLGEKAVKVNFVVSDILDFNTSEKFDVIHDRASFHFLTNEKDIQKYVALIENSIIKNGLYFVGTFSESGPLKCSGLEITQYSKEKFLKIFGNDFSLLNSFEEAHKTPFDTTQNFIFAEMKRK